METQLIRITDIEATAEQIKERLGKYDFLRIFEDEKGLHIYNTPMQAEILLYREPFGLCGRAIYGRILYEKHGDFRYIQKAQFDHALQRLFEMADKIRHGKV